MRLVPLLCLAVLAVPTAAQTVIDFDDQPGQGGLSFEGQSARPGAIVIAQYLPLGVLFDSTGGGLGRVVASNFVSPPNVVVALTPAHLLSYSSPAQASFWTGAAPATVDFVQLTLTDSSSPSTLEAYDFQGLLLATSKGSLGAILRVDAPGAIHSVRVQQGPMAFDDFTFDGLTAIGALAASPPQPGRAGQQNKLVVTGAEPFEPLLLWLDVGAEGAPVAPGVVSLVADATGRVEHSFFVPEGLATRVLRARVLGQASGLSPFTTDVLAPAERSVRPAPWVGPTLLGTSRASPPLSLVK